MTMYLNISFLKTLEFQFLIYHKIMYIIIFVERGKLCISLQQKKMYTIKNNIFNVYETIYIIGRYCSNFSTFDKPKKRFIKNRTLCTLQNEQFSIPLQVYLRTYQVN